MENFNERKKTHFCSIAMSGGKKWRRQRRKWADLEELERELWSVAKKWFEKCENNVASVVCHKWMCE